MIQERIYTLLETFREPWIKLDQLPNQFTLKKFRDFPDFEQIKNERLEVMYADFAVFLAKQAIVFLNRLETPDYNDNDLYSYRNKSDDYRQNEEENNKNLTISQPFGGNSDYPSVTNLHSQVEKNHFRNYPQNISSAKNENQQFSVMDEDLEKALRIQQEFQRQHNLLSRELSSQRKPECQEKENTHTENNQDFNEFENLGQNHPGTVSVPNFAP